MYQFETQLGVLTGKFIEKVILFVFHENKPKTRTQMGNQSIIHELQFIELGPKVLMVKIGDQKYITYEWFFHKALILCFIL